MHDRWHPIILSDLDSGFRVVAQESFQATVPLSRKAYVDYVVTETNVAAAVQATRYLQSARGAKRRWPTYGLARPRSSIHRVSQLLRRDDADRLADLVHNQNMTRRSFSRLAALGTALTPTIGSVASTTSNRGRIEVRLAVSTYRQRHLRGERYPIEKVIENAADLGFDGALKSFTGRWRANRRST